MLASTEPPPPGPKKKTAKSPGPPGPEMTAWARRMLDDGLCLSQLFGRSKSMAPAAGCPGWVSATAPPCAEMGAGAEESPAGWLGAAASVAGVAVGASVAGA